MFKILILTFFIYLIYRIFTKIIDQIEVLITSLIKPTQKSNNLESQSQSKQSKSAKVGSKISPVKENQKQKSLIVNSSQKNIIKLQKVPSTVVEEKPKLQVKSEILPSSKSNLTYKQFEQELKELKEEDEQKHQVESLREQIEEYRATIERLQQQIEQHKQQKASYINKIQEIIQHVIQEQEKPIIIPQNSEDEEMRALAQLTKGIDLAHQTETKKYQKREQELKQNMKQQQNTLQQRHLVEIQQIQRKLNLKEQQVITLQQQIISTKLQPRAQVQPQKQESNFQKDLKAKEQEIVKLRTQKQLNQTTLKEKEQQRERLQAQIMQLRASLSDLQNQRRVELQQLEENQTQIATLNQENQQLAQNLRSTMIELDNFNQQLKKLRNKSSTEQIDKLQSDLKLQDHLRSLKESKADLQKQVIQLNEDLQAQGRDRRQQIEALKEELTTKHEAEIEKLNSIIQKAQEEKAQAQKKILQIQSELQFAQIQLKSTIQSQKKLSEQIATLKTPRRQDRNISPNLSGVRVNSEGTQLNKKVEQPSEQVKIEQSETSLPERKVNFVRTKLQRQASPTFQYESKEKSPQVDKPRDKPISSSIFTGVFQKVKSPIDLRYNTPVQKTIVQSSIYQGGIISEGFFGETSILNQQQREFILSQINHLKKISAKKTRLLYRSLNNKNNKPISEYVSNVPNLLIVVELANKRVLGAFTQAAFNKQLNNQAERKYVNNNKAFIIDITKETVVQNSTNSQTIRYDEKALIWGKNEFVVSSEEPLLLTCDLNCQGAVYPSKYSSDQWCGENESSPISQFEVYRIFLG